MELFYYCLSAPKEEQQQRTTHYYVPASPDPICYDEMPAKTLESDDDEAEPLTYTDLNESLHEVDGPEKQLFDDGQLSPVEESTHPEIPIPVIVEPEHGVNLLQRHNSRKFKTPSFKWKKKKKNRDSGRYPSPSAPELSNLTVDGNQDVEKGGVQEISIDSLNDRLKEKEEEVNAAAAQNEAESERLLHDVQFFKDRLREAEELLNRYKTDNIMLHQRVELAERDRGAMQHGNYMELEKVREEYQTRLGELSHYPEKLSSAEARYQHAEAETEALRSQLADKHRSVEELNKKIDVFQEQIGKLKDKFHAVNEDNIELSNKTQSHERKVMEADLHNKNLMDLVSKKDDAVEHHQVRSYGAATSSPSPTGSERAKPVERDKYPPLNGPMSARPYTEVYNQPHADFARLTSELQDRDKSLTSRSRQNLHQHGRTPLYPYHSVSPLLSYDADPRLLDSYVLSRLHFEEFLRSQSELFHQMMIEREKALSVKSDSNVATPRNERDRAGSSQSDTIPRPQYSVPRKPLSSTAGADQGGDNSFSKLGPDTSAGYEPVRSGSYLNSYHHKLLDSSSRDISSLAVRDALSRDTLASSRDSSSHHSATPPIKYFDPSLVRTSSLTELDHLVNNCIMPDDMPREPTPPPPFIRVQRHCPVVPRGRTVSPIEDSDDNQMLLGGVLSVPHANKFVDERTFHSTNGNHVTNGVETDHSDSNSQGKSQSKSSLFGWKKSSKNKAKSKSKKEAVAATLW